ncbi:TetR/AcrR family transcriptional regulator [Bradyrhizobium sp. Arg314]
MEKPGKKTSRAERKARRPQEILEAAFEEFTGKGYAATRVEDVAARLGVTKGTIYLYFPTKDELFEAMTRHMSAPFSDLRASVATLEGPCSERLKALFRLAYEKVVNDRRMRELLRLSLAEGARFPHIVDRHHDEFIAPLEDAVGALIRQGVSSGEFHQTAAASAPGVVISPILHASFLRLMYADRRPFDEAAFIEAHIDLVLKGLLQRH